MSQPNRGVTCSVETCRYHSGRETCVAPVICVKDCAKSSSSAHKCEETICDTFEMR